MIEYKVTHPTYMVGATTARLSVAIAQRIVERIATNMQTNVSVTDRAATVIASTHPHLVASHHALAAQAVSTGLFVEESTGLSVSCPLTYSDETFGALVFTSEAPYDPSAIRMARTLAEMIIHQMVVIERLPQQQWARDRFVRDLLSGALHSAPVVAHQESSALGIDLDVPRIVVLITQAEARGRLPSQEYSVAEPPTLMQRAHVQHVPADLLDQVRQTVGGRRQDVCCVISDQWIVVLAAVEPAHFERCRQHLVDATQRLIDYAAASGEPPISAGIGRYYPGWQSLTRSFADARFALETGMHLYGAGRVFLPRDLGLPGFVCSDDRLFKTALAQHLLQPLAAEPELQQTLETFLHADLSPSLAAQQLHIHRHTLAYRLDKITQLTGLDPRQFEAAAQLYAALTLQHVCPTAT